VIRADSENAPWPIHLMLESNRAITVDILANFFPDLPPGCWIFRQPRARLVPLMRQGQEKPAGVFIATLNPYRALDSNYSGFLDLVSGQIAASITTPRPMKPNASAPKAWPSWTAPKPPSSATSAMNCARLLR